MKICRYDDGRPGLIDGDSVYPLGDALASAGAVHPGAGMAEVVDALASHSSAGKALAAARQGRPVALSSARLLPRVADAPPIWAASMNYAAHHVEMRERVGASIRSDMPPDDLMAELFEKPASSLVGPGGTVILPKIAAHVDFECELCA